MEEDRAKIPYKMDIYDLLNIFKNLQLVYKIKIK